MTRNSTPQEYFDRGHDLRKHDKPKYWQGDISERDDFGADIDDTFYDGKTRQGPWAIMSPR
jgi:hypothetical protein